MKHIYRKLTILVRLLFIQIYHVFQCVFRYICRKLMRKIYRFNEKAICQPEFNGQTKFLNCQNISLLLVAWVLPTYSGCRVTRVVDNDNEVAF